MYVYTPLLSVSTRSIARVGGAIRVRCPSLLLPQNYGTLDHYIHELSFGPHLPGLEVSDNAHLKNKTVYRVMST